VAPDQFAAILACIAEGVTVQDASGRLVYANDAAARLSGFESGEELVAGSPSDTLRRFKLLDQDGLEVKRKKRFNITGVKGVPADMTAHRVSPR